MYEYKFVEVLVEKKWRAKRGEHFEKCKEIINEEAKNGWRFKQIVSPINENVGVDIPYAYEIIFEKKMK